MRKLVLGILMLGAATLSAHHGEAIPYDQAPTEEQKQAAQFMMNKLANTGLFSLRKLKPQLKAEGDKTATLHPLRFFLYVFETPKLRADLKKLRGRGLVWRNFMNGQPDGWANTFNAQANLGNMKKEYIDSYAESLGINPGPLWTEVQKRNWTGFIDQTFTELGRSGRANGQMGNGRQPSRARSRASRQ